MTVNQGDFLPFKNFFRHNTEIFADIGIERQDLLFGRRYRFVAEWEKHGMNISEYFFIIFSGKLEGV